MSKWYQDDSFVEHGCCWDHAIVTKVKDGEGQYGEDVAIVAEVSSQEYVDKILALDQQDDEI